MAKAVIFFRTINPGRFDEERPASDGIMLFLTIPAVGLRLAFP
jgi:hypothetical protein